MLSTGLTLALLTCTALSAYLPERASSSGSTGASVWNVQNFQNLVTFGDSYTDENRLNYFLAHGGQAPPPGTFLPETFMAPSGGRTWDRYVIQYTGSTVNGQWDPSMTLYDYAVSGAVCSNLITPRYLAALNGDFPSVLEYEVPAFKSDMGTMRNGTDQPYFTTTLSNSNSVYSLWIGTNDLGVGAFLTDSQVPGKVLTDYTDCVYQVFDELYAEGARNFVLMNTIPLQLAPLYANETLNGCNATDCEYWPDKPDNHTAIAEKMHEYTTSVNTIFRYQTPFNALVANRYPSASWALFDVWQLISDIYDDPTAYYNGTEPIDITGPEHTCNADNVCTNAYNGTSPDSFMWYDTLHPSEQTDRIIARNFVNVLNGNSTYATYY